MASKEESYCDFGLFIGSWPGKRLRLLRCMLNIDTDVVSELMPCWIQSGP